MWLLADKMLTKKSLHNLTQLTSPNCSQRSAQRTRVAAGPFTKQNTLSLVPLPGLSACTFLIQQFSHDWASSKQVAANTSHQQIKGQGSHH